MDRGWIAVYNALQLMGRNVEPEELITFFERQLPLIHGNFGTMPLAPVAYFRRCGFSVEHTVRRDRFDELVKRSDAAVLYYWWRNGWHIGAHFVAVRYTEKGFVGYNTYSNSSGPDFYGPSLEKLLKEKKRFFTVLTGIRTG